MRFLCEQGFSREMSVTSNVRGHRVNGKAPLNVLLNYTDIQDLLKLSGTDIIATLSSLGATLRSVQVQHKKQIIPTCQFCQGAQQYAPEDELVGEYVCKLCGHRNNLSDALARALKARPFKDATVTVGEHDPNGKQLNTPGAKADAGKPRPDLVLGGFADALQAVVEVGSFGASKYTPNGWKTVPDGIARYSDAALRHWFAVQQDGVLSRNMKDGDVLHQAQIIWNLLAVLQLALAERKAKA